MIQRFLSPPEWFHDITRFGYYRRKGYCRGFTLVELLAVMAIIATLAGIAVPMYLSALEKARVAKGTADIHSIGNEISTYRLFNGGWPLSLADVGRATFHDPYGNPYEYLAIACDETLGKCKAPAGARKDQFLKPLNSDFDLYSKGRDGQSVSTLNAKKSWDDIIRANDGGFVGLASEF